MLPTLFSSLIKFFSSFLVNVTVFCNALVFLQCRVLINFLCVCLTILHNGLRIRVVYIQQEIDLLKVSLVFRYADIITLTVSTITFLSS